MLLLLAPGEDAGDSLTLLLPQLRRLLLRCSSLPPPPFELLLLLPPALCLLLLLCLDLIGVELVPIFWHYVCG